jgi:hypothetical protein
MYQCFQLLHVICIYFYLLCKRDADSGQGYCRVHTQTCNARSELAFESLSKLYEIVRQCVYVVL